MATLDEFNEEVPLSIEDLSTDTHIQKPVSNKASNVNLAAHASVLVENPEVLETSFRVINSELEAESQSQAAENILREVKAKTFAQNRQAFIEFLADPSVSDEDKKAVSSDVLDERSDMFNMRSLVAREATIKDVPNETVESETVRINASEEIEKVNKYKRHSQAILNKEIAKGDISTLNAFADIFSFLVPFVEQKISGSIITDIRDGEDWAYEEALTLMGSTKAGPREMLEKLSPEARYELTDKLVESINNNSSIILTDENDFARHQMLRSYLEDGFYEDSDVWIDNIVSLLDLTFLGGIAARGVKGAGRAFLKGGEFGVSAALMTAAAQRNVTRMLTRTRVQPTSLSQTVKDVNPEQARVMHEAMATADEELANALYGTTKNDAIANDLLPEVGNADGLVRSKVSTPNSVELSAKTPDADTMDFAETSGALHYWQQEKIDMRSNVVNDFHNAEGMQARKEMFQIDELGDGLKVNAVYGPKNGGFNSPQDALDMAEWSLRNYDLPEGSIKLLRREGDNYVPTTIQEIEALSTIQKVVSEARGKVRGKEVLREVKVLPDYLVSVESTYKFNPADIVKWSEADVQYNIFDRIGFMKGTSDAGSFQQHVLDAHSMLHENITFGASVAVDKASALEKQLLGSVKEFGEGYKSSKKQDLLMKYILDANENGLDLTKNTTQLIAAGLVDKDIKVLADWKEMWDTMYWLENKDLARTLRSQDFHNFVDKANDTSLFAKPFKDQDSIPSSLKVYDQSTNTIRRADKAELDELYARNGVAAKLKSPMELGDDVAEWVLSTEQAGKSHLRRINDSTQVLNYRNGYYQVQYKNPIFIDRIVRDADGNVAHKPVATAGNIVDADTFISRLEKTKGGEYRRRDDKKKLDSRSDDYFNLQLSRGRSSQRARGKRLEDASSAVDDPSKANILDPIESLVSSVRSISTRTSMRDFLETSKTRMIKQFKDYLPKNKFGEPVFPNNVSDIEYRGDGTIDPKKLGDARTTFNYLRSLEAGYWNAIDDGVKAGFKVIADVFGNAGNKKLEKGARWLSEARGPSAISRNATAQMYLMLNPLRQFIVQGHQAVQLAANFPGWILNVKKSGAEVAVLTSFQAGFNPPASTLKLAGLSLSEAKTMFKQFNRSGLVAGIDRQNLVNGALADLADQVAAGGIKKALFFPLTLSRKIGFDAGENFNMMTSWLAHRDEAIRAGKSLDNSEVADRVTGSARNYTYNMNAAGDLPYNQNALSVIFQFQQVPHKAALQMLTNRALTPMQKIRLGVFNATMYTLPPTLMISLFNGILPDNQEARNAIINGLEGAIFNYLLSKSFDQDVDIDWSGLSPVGLHGTYELIHSLITTDPGEIIAATPAGSLLFGGNPRLTDATVSIARYFNPFNNPDEDPASFSVVMKSVAQLSSGYSSTMRANLALEYGKKISTTNTVTDSNVESVVAIANYAGFGSLDEVQSFYVKRTIYEKTAKHKDDVTKWYKEYKRELLREGITVEETEFVKKVYNKMLALGIGGTDGTVSEKTRDIVKKLMNKDIEDKDLRLFDSIARSVGLFSESDKEKMYKAIPNLPDETLQQILETEKKIRELGSE